MFHLKAPDELRTLAAARSGQATELAWTRDDLVDILKKKGLYDGLSACTQEVMDAAQHEGVGSDDLDDVLMVGGSTLLPGVFPLFEERFGRDRVRAWQPFQAVAHGACALSARGFAPWDFVVHDYAIKTWKTLLEASPVVRLL